MIEIISKPSKFRIRLILLAVLLLFVPGIAAQQETPVPNPQTEAQEPYRILYLNLRPGLWPWLLAMYSASRDHLQSITGRPVEMIVENTTIADGESPAARRAFITLFHERYHDNIDFIVVRRQFSQIESIVEVFPNVPVIITDQNLALATEWNTPPDNVHEVRYEIRVDKIAQVALQMRPQTQKIIVVAGLDPFDQSLEASAREQLGDRYNGVEVGYWSGVPVPELVERVASLPEDYLILFLATTLDENGTLTISADVVKELSAAATVPIFGFADTFMPNGIVGGYVFSSKVSGRRSAEMMNQLLQGQPLPGITNVEEYGEYLFDWQQMQRWGIPESRLPADATLLNRPDGFFERNVWVLPTLGIAGALLVFSIIGLLWHLRMRRQIEEAIMLSEERLRLSTDMAGVAVWEYDLVENRITRSANHDRLYGVEQQDEWNVDTFLNYVHPDDRELALRNLQEALRPGGSGRYSFDFRVIWPDGSVHWLALPGEVTERDANGGATKVRGCLIDITKRKQAEAALRESEARLIFAQHIAKLGHYSFEIETAKVTWSQGMFDLLGYDKSEKIDLEKLNIKIHHPDDLERILGWANDCINSEKTTPSLNEYRLIRKDGKVIRVQATASIKHKDGKPFEMIGTVQDITARKQAEEALRENAQQLEAIFNNSLNAIMVADDAGNYIRVNQAAADMFGYPVDQLLHMNVGDLRTTTVPDAAERYQTYLQKGHEIGDFDFVRPDGQPGIAQYHAVRVDENFNLSVLSDITKRKQAEEALRLSEEKFRGIYEQSPLAIQLYDKAGKLIDVNPQTLEMFGIEDKKHIRGYNMWTDSNYTPETIEALQNGRPIYIAASLDFETIKKRNVYPTNKSGVIYGDLHAAPLMRGKEITGYLVQVIDTTERKAMETRLLQSQKMESIGRLAGGIAHDFNNILVPIIGYVELALMRLQPTDPLYSDLERVRKATDRATGLVRQILAFSRKQILEMRVLDLNAIVVDFETMLQRLIGEDIALQTFLEPDLYQVNADAGQIEQVLMNLAINARDAMPAGGNMTIETANVYLDESYITKYQGTQAPGHYVMLAVSDTGCGMDSETRQQIFDPFFTTKEPGKGTGLGLSTVFGIIKQHGGNIWVYSESNKGTTFKIYLPKVDSPVPTSKTTATQPASMDGTETILVIEDEDMVRQLVCETLTAHGYEVLEAQSPSDGLRLVAEGEKVFHLLLTDVIMPEMNGRDLYQKMAALDPDIKVLYMSGYTDNVIVHHGILKKGINFLQKPFTVQSLTQKVRQVLNQGAL
ncbi:MAG: PAS domain S-box protein [Anaerolineae bacterium]|nr:PAS domain S-box protein [Anaerolineae bacterium]